MQELRPVEPVTLVGRAIRLEPLRVEHAADLAELATPELLKYHITIPTQWDTAGVADYIERLWAIPGYVPFAQVVQESGKAVGITCYFDIRPPHRGLEIGGTWIGKPYQQTAVNPEAKYLLMRHAFESLNAVRVQLKADSRNAQSRAAMLKLGAQFEGILRKHIVLPDGYIRDTAMFSVILEEWPGVKAALEARLGYVPGLVS